MLNTKMCSVMKNTKDRMDNFMPVAEMNQLLDVLKTTGATHIEVATVMGHTQFVTYSKQWADAIHAKGMKVTWRCAHELMEGLYGQTALVGPLRKPTQFWIDEAVNAIKALGAIVQSGDEWAIYPERTQGVFQDSTSWIDPNGLPGTYGQFFFDLHAACKSVLPTGVNVGLSSNNASELLSGWMPKIMSDTYGVVCIDHYVDGNPTQYDSDVRAVSAKYGKPVYVQEGAPNRFATPTRTNADAYFAVNKKLADDGVLVGFGSWSGWTGTPEAILQVNNGVYSLNDQGLSLQAWWGGAVPVPTPTPPPVIPEHFVDVSGTTSSFIAVTDRGHIWKFSNGVWTKLSLPF